MVLFSFDLTVKGFVDIGYLYPLSSLPRNKGDHSRSRSSSRLKCARDSQNKLQLPKGAHSITYALTTNFVVFVNCYIYEWDYGDNVTAIGHPDTSRDFKVSAKIRTANGWWWEEHRAKSPECLSHISPTSPQHIPQAWTKTTPNSTTKPVLVCLGTKILNCQLSLPEKFIFFCGWSHIALCTNTHHQCTGMPFQRYYC